MGYTTEFRGSFKLDRPLAIEHKTYLEKFAETRRMNRDAGIASGFPDPVREAAGLPIGENACNFTGGLGFCGQDGDPSVLNHNSPPPGQPGLWCQWVPDYGGTQIIWDEGEKFYFYVEWIEYLIANFLGPWGYVLNGSVDWVGEDVFGDRGTIKIVDNVVTVKEFANA